jgi:uncharacterized membrane protein (UPF0127 family)
MKTLAEAAAVLITAARTLLACVALLGGGAVNAAQGLESLDNFPQGYADVSSRDGPQRFKIWITDTPARSEQGLMFVHSLAHDRGMLIPRNNAGPMAIWMKNTFIPLDILFLDAQGQIIFIRRNATPLSEAIISVPAPMTTPAQAVLELAGGECDRRHISQGDVFHLAQPK